MPGYIDRHPLTEQFEFYSPGSALSRTCPLCGHPMMLIRPGFMKCMYDGYSDHQPGTLTQQHHYDFNRASLKGRRVKYAYPHQELLPYEYEYNLLVEAGWPPEEAFQMVVDDFGLQGERLDYFEGKVTNSGGGMVEDNLPHGEGM